MKKDFDSEPQVSRRIMQLAVAGVAVAAVAGAAIVGSAVARTGKQTAQTPDTSSVPAAVPAAAPATVAPKAVTKNGYTFQNERQPPATLLAGVAAQVGINHWLQTKGSTWALLSQLPGQPRTALFGWQATKMDDISGATLLMDGSKAGAVLASMFRTDRITTVVYAQGKKAWYGKVYKLAGVPGLTAAGVELKGISYVGSVAGPADPSVAVYAYDKNGKLVSQFQGTKADPLAGGPGKLLAGGYEVMSKVDPRTIKPTERPLPKDPVAACKTLLANTGEPKPGRNAKVVARLDGAPGSVLVLADGNYWAGCDTAYGRHDGQGSLRKPARIRQPSAMDADTFFVANNIIPVKGKQYEYYWAAGLMPAGVAKISYTFPDGVTSDAVVEGNYWVMQHQEATPWKEGADADRPQIKVKLTRANGSVVSTLLLTWGTQTCAQISHGC